MLDPTLLSAFISTFYGYGTWNAPYWFIGMEEGGGNDAEQIETRLNVSNHRGRRELEDLHDYHEANRVPQHSGASAKLQSTWSKLVRIILAANGQSAETEAVRRYQGTRLGRTDGESALIELLPLPSRSTPALALRRIGNRHPSRSGHLSRRTDSETSEQNSRAHRPTPPGKRGLLRHRLSRSVAVHRRSDFHS